MKDIVVIGAGGFAREVIWLIEEINKQKLTWNILGYIDEDIKKHNILLNGYKVLGDYKWFNNKENIYYVCAIGNSKIRKKIVEEKINKYYIKAATLIHPSVSIDNKTTEIGEGTIICSHSSITVNIKIKNHCIVNLNSTIGHDVTIENYVTVYPNASISGNCALDEAVELGTGARIIQGKAVGKNAIIGAGAVVINDIEENTTNVGVPSKVIKR